LYGTNVTDEGLRELATLKNLTTLDLRRTKVTGEGLKELATLKNLTTFSDITKVTGEGLKELATPTKTDWRDNQESQTDDDFLHRLQKLVAQFQKDIAEVVGASDSAFTRKVAATNDLESERALKSQITAFRQGGHFPINLDLIDIAAKEEKARSLRAMSILELLQKGKNVASQKKWRQSFSYCERTISRLDASMFKLSLYSALEKGTSISLEAYDGRAESQVVLKVARRERGTIGVTLDGSFLSSDKSGQGTIQGNFSFTMPGPPSAIDLFLGRDAKNNDATFFEDGEMTLYTCNKHKGEFREVRTVNPMGFDAYDLMIVLERKLPRDLPNKTAKEEMDELISKKFQEGRVKTLEDILGGTQRIYDELPRKPKTLPFSAIIMLKDCLTSGVDSTQVRDRYSSILGMKAVSNP